MVNYFHYLDHDRQLEAVLEVSGVFVAGFDSDIEPSLGRLYFITAPLKEDGMVFAAQEWRAMSGWCHWAKCRILCIQRY